MLKDDIVDVTVLTNIAGITAAQRQQASHCSEFRIQLSDWLKMCSSKKLCEKALKCRTFNYISCQLVIALGVLSIALLVTSSNEKHGDDGLKYHENMALIYISSFI